MRRLRAPRQPVMAVDRHNKTVVRPSRLIYGM